VKKFVLDVSAWVSVFYSDKHLHLIALIEEEEIELFTSEENISEFADVHIKHKKVARLLPLHTSVYVEAMEEMCAVFAAHKRYALLPDYKDNYLVDLAHQTHAILVTNDKHFKVAKKLNSPKLSIIFIQEFYKMLDL
jgi:putative PIN family toxin of toxin-antitoxin system